MLIGRERAGEGIEQTQLGVVRNLRRQRSVTLAFGHIEQHGGSGIESSDSLIHKNAPELLHPRITAWAEWIGHNSPRNMNCRPAKIYAKIHPAPFEIYFCNAT
jgi:hypothetical protein